MTTQDNKVRITLKDPDGSWEGLRQIADEDLRDEVAAKFFTYSEYLTIEVDLSTMQARVVGAKER